MPPFFFGGFCLSGAATGVVLSLEAELSASVVLSLVVASVLGVSDVVSSEVGVVVLVCLVSEQEARTAAQAPKNSNFSVLTMRINKRPKWRNSSEILVSSK